MIHLFVGVPGSGKTMAMQDTVSILSEQWPCYVNDSCHEWQSTLIDGSVNWRWRGRPPRIVVAPPPPRGADALEVMRDWALENATAGVYVFPTYQGWEALDVAALVGYIGDAYYVDDEIDKMATYKAWDANPLKEFLHRGRHTLNHAGVPSEVHVLGAMRRPQSVHTDLTNLCDEAFIFRCQGDKTISRLLSDGFIEDRHANEVNKMPNLHFLRWRNDGSILKGHLLPPVVPQAA